MRPNFRRRAEALNQDALGWRPAPLNDASGRYVEVAVRHGRHVDSDGRIEAMAARRCSTWRLAAGSGTLKDVAHGNVSIGQSGNADLAVHADDELVSEGIALWIPVALHSAGIDVHDPKLPNP